MSEKNLKYKSPKNNKQTKQNANPKCKNQTIQANNPDNYYKLNAKWKFHRYCLDNSLPISKDDWSIWENNILPKLIEFQEMTWEQIFKIPKGRGGGSKHHNVRIDKFTDKGLEIIDNLKIECDEVFSLRLSGKERIIGFLELGVLEILCYDPGHEFIQSSKKHT